MSFVHVQPAFTSHGSGNISSISATGSAVGSGNIVMGFANCGQGTTGNFSSVSNGTTNAAMVDDVADATNGQEVISWFDANVTIAPTTYTANFTSSAFDLIIWDEFSGVATASPADGHAMQLQASASAGTDALSANNGTGIGHSGNLLYGGTCQTDNTNGGTTVGTGFAVANDHHSDTNGPSITEYLTQTGAHDATFSITTGGAFITGAMSFKPAAGGDVLMAQACL